MRSVILIAEEGQLRELKHAIHYPLSQRLRFQLQRMQERLPKELSEEECKIESGHLARKRRGYRFLLADSSEVALSYCRQQTNHWMPPFFLVVSGNAFGMRAVRTFYAGLPPKQVSDIVVMSNIPKTKPSATRQEDGVLMTVGAMSDQVVSDAVLGALVSFIVDDRVQFRIEPTLKGSVRPPPLGTSSVSI